MSILPCDSNSFGRLYFSISNLQLPFLTSYLLKYIDATSMGKGKRLAMEPYRFFPNSFLNAVLIVFRQFDRRRQWHPTPVLLPGKSHGWRTLVGCSPWGREESDTTARLHFHFSLSCIGEGNGNPLQCSCLENPRDRGAWWAAVYGVAQSWT